MTPSDSLLGFSPAEIHFSRSFDLGRFLGCRQNGSYEAPKHLEIEFHRFRSDRNKFKSERLVKRNITLGSKVRIKSSHDEWSPKVFRVVRIQADTIGVREIGNPNASEISRAYNHVRLA